MDNKVYTIKIPFASGRKNLIEDISVDDLKNISGPIIDKAVSPISDALDKAGLEPENIDLVILAGGSSQLPGVSEKIKEMIGIAPRSIPKNLMLAISYGAALYQRDIFNLPKKKCEVRTLGTSLGIYVDDGGRRAVKLLMNHNEPLPVSKKEKFSVSEGQDTVSINLVTLKGNSDNVEKRLKKRNLKLSGTATDIVVTIEVDTNRLITITAYDPENPQEKSIIQLDNKVLTDYEIQERQKTLGIEVVYSDSRNNMQPCIGIDLGTTTSEMAYTNRSGEAELRYLKNPEENTNSYAEYCFPSVVYFPDGLNNPETANQKACDALSNAEAVEAGLVCNNFKIADRSKYAASINGKNLTVADLSTYLINKIWNSAMGNFSDMNIKNAVVTVPASFDFDACLDTYNAARSAGIETVTLIDEPTAAFLYYKYIQDLDDSDIQNVLVFDFGGGTSDVAILDIKNSEYSDNSEYKDSLYTVLSVSGNEKCGGKHVDDALVEEIKNRFEEKNNCKISATNIRRLRNEVEKAKIILSDAYNGED